MQMRRTRKEKQRGLCQQWIESSSTPFATEEERTLLSKLEEQSVKGSFVQRFVQSLMERQWPALRAHLRETKEGENQPLPPSDLASSLDASSPVQFASSSSHSTSALLMLRRNEVEFWLCTRAHIRGEQSGEGELFTAPRLHGAKREWLSSIKRNVGEEEQRAREGGVSLTQQLQEWKRKEREALQLQARVFQTKRPLSTHPLHLHRRASAGAAVQAPPALDGFTERKANGVSESRSRVTKRIGDAPRRPRMAPPQLSSSTLSALLRSQSPLTPRTRAVVQELAKVAEH